MFISERERFKVENDTLFLISKECFHRFSIENQESYERYVPDFGDIGEYGEMIASLMTDNV